MPLFITIGYGDRDGYDRTDEDVRNAAHEHDERLRLAGVVMGIAGPPIQVRNHGGTGAQAKTGQYLSADLPVAGFAIIEAANMDDAVAAVAQTPCAVSHGVVEVWPLQQ